MLKKERPFFTLKTPLEKIPRDWLIEIEPRIERSTLLRDCWIWTGRLDRDGHPVFVNKDKATGKWKVTRVARFVMKIFFPKLASHNDVTHACGNLSCLNPHHLSVRIEHWSQRIDHGGGVQ